jgi:uncharacterized membrane protein YvbJ
MFSRRMLIASLAAFVAASVVGGHAANAADADSPAGVMTAFFTAVEKGDYNAAKALLSTKGKAKMTDESLKGLTEILKGGQDQVQRPQEAESDELLPGEGRREVAVSGELRRPQN